MESKKLTDLTVEELMEKEQKLKKNAVSHAFLIGLSGGVAIYSLVKNGLVWPTFFPLLIGAFLEKRRRDETKALQQEIEARKSQ
jgi:ABC-type Mn2+/Zn2+ transport system permease subunit